MKQIAQFLDQMIGRVALFGFGFFAGVGFIGLSLMNDEVIHAVIDAEMNEQEAVLSILCEETEFGSTRCRLNKSNRTQTEEKGESHDH